jgi:replication-associated recombination protein RarA
MIYKQQKKRELRTMVNWNEQIRPTSWGEIAGNEQFVADFKGWDNSGLYPSALLLVGPSGTGKTSAANAITHTMLGQWNNDMNVLWMNASDDRGIDYIRKEIKHFARLSGVGVGRKVVVCDEACGLTPASQDALRGIMEKYADRVLFVLTANYPDKIRPAIKSRCQMYVFKPVTPKQGAKHLARLESCGAPPEWNNYYEMVVELKGGDLRSAVNYLESLPKKPDALAHLSAGMTDDDDWMNDFIANDWLVLRETLLDSLNRVGSRFAMMNQFHRTVKGHFDTKPDTVFAILNVWGDMMEKVHEWPGNDNTYIDVLVARLKKQSEMIK